VAKIMEKGGLEPIYSSGEVTAGIIIIQKNR